MKKVLVLSMLICLLVQVSIFAQEIDMIHYYILPAEVVGDIYRGPKYLKWRFNSDGMDVQWSCKDYGTIDIMVCAIDASAPQHTTLAAHADTYQFPENLDVSPSPAELSALETVLEATYIPADWLSPSETWRDALRTVTSMFLLMQRLTAITGTSPLEWGVTLNTAFRNLEQQHQDALVQAFDDLDYDSAAIKTNWTLRVILKNAADSWGETPIIFGMITTL